VRFQIFTAEDMKLTDWLSQSNLTRQPSGISGIKRKDV
jgi:hypothetical protein